MFLVRILSLLETPKSNISKIHIISNIKSSIFLLVRGTLDIIEPTPSTKHEFIIQAPIIFPSAISSLPFIIATVEVISSGKDVPKAIIVRPIILSGIFSSFAMLIEELTVKSPPNFKKRPPNNIYI